MLWMKKKMGRHRKLQKKIAGRTGILEYPINGYRLDVLTNNKAYEIERTGNPNRIEKALRRLAMIRKPIKILKVPNKDLEKALRIARKKGVKVTISNLSGTKYRYP